MLETESARIYCDYCERNTRHERDVKRPNHILHLLLSVFTMGFWLLVWIFLGLSVQKGKWSCSQCGEVPEGESTPFWQTMLIGVCVAVWLIVFMTFFLAQD